MEPETTASTEYIPTHWRTVLQHEERFKRLKPYFDDIHDDEIRLLDENALILSVNKPEDRLWMCLFIRKYLAKLFGTESTIQRKGTDEKDLSAIQEKFISSQSTKEDETTPLLPGNDVRSYPTQALANTNTLNGNVNNNNSTLVENESSVLNTEHEKAKNKGGKQDSKLSTEDAKTIYNLFFGSAYENVKFGCCKLTTTVITIASASIYGKKNLYTIHNELQSNGIEKLIQLDLSVGGLSEPDIFFLSNDLLPRMEKVLVVDFSGNNIGAFNHNDNITVRLEFEKAMRSILDKVEYLNIAYTPLSRSDNPSFLASLTDTQLERLIWIPQSWLSEVNWMNFVAQVVGKPEWVAKVLSTHQKYYALSLPKSELEAVQMYCSFVSPAWGGIPT